MHRIDRPLLAFFVLAFAIAWCLFGVAAWLAATAGLSGASELLTRAEALDFAGYEERLPVPAWIIYLGTRVIDFAFTLAAVTVIGATQGRAGLLALARRMSPSRGGGRWLILGLVPLGMYAMAALLAVSTSAGQQIVLDLRPETLRALLFSANAGLVFAFFLRGAMGEEPGLRGFALVRLQERVGAVRASLAIGILWAAWHLPGLLGRGLIEVAAFLVLAVLLSFVMTWLFNGGGGSLLPPMLFHATQNTEEVFEELLPFLAGSQWEFASTIGMLVFGALVTVMVIRRTRHGRSAPS
jgi:membrane protease YdiL (CAAX protease family)